MNRVQQPVQRPRPRGLELLVEFVLRGLDIVQRGEAILPSLEADPALD